ncbi:flagellar motor protein MotB [Uliginosibacterium sp. 31-16]|uniref:flagellar motor protein MotB n=1 Tax=Uliginosibacterium sp. 31-16 TaxID=3068315 RepID=UPI00273E9AF1|nr:flagellar motor protein MotB [Uliginosibacterium sp. 31-16]MDP5240287.1 flagellar motor protein MotB [Uliginosibacterium sp. 31-16]
MADNQQPIIVKRIKKGGGGAHGGAWKIAYADFVTAMMAFFLLMWLLGSTTKGDLKGIADHFQSPLKLSMAGGPGTGSSNSPLSGGGTDLTKSVGDAARGDYKEPRKISEVKVIPADSTMSPGEAKKLTPEQQAALEKQAAAKMQQEKAERLLLQDVKAKVEAVIEASVNLRQFKSQLLLDLTSEGLRIQIVDEKNRPMFDTSSADMKPYTREIVRAIGQVLNQVENKVSISGHTDAAQYAGGSRGFSNWELSANRANASRRELIAGGMDERKIMRVVGLSSTIPLDRNDPYSPINRRITLIVMNKRTEEAILQEGRDLDVNASTPVEPQPIVDGAREELTRPVLALPPRAR